MRFRMLGPLRVRDGDGWVPVAAAQQRVVLAVLLVEAGRVVSTEKLVDAVWPERPPRTAANTIAAYVLRLRRLVGAGVLATRGRGYLLVTDDGDIDAVEFEQHLEAGRRELRGGRIEAAATRLGQALALWQGPEPALADVPPNGWLAARVEYLDQLRLAATEEHLGVLLELGRHTETVDQLHRMVHEQPLRERRWALLMTALDRAGRRGEALQAYRHAQQVLRAELGLEPGAQLRRLQQAILAGTSSPSVLTGRPAATPAQLPADVVGFAGRVGELARLDALLDRDALAPAVVISTVSGTAGVGKTALAVHWAHRIADRFGDGQLYVNLRGFDPAGAPMTAAEAVRRFLDALAVPPQRIPADLDAQAALYRTLLAGRKMLILLDNARDPSQIRPLLPGAPGCLVLITSRNQLPGLVAADGAHPLALDLLTVAEAHELLARRLGPDRVATEPGAVERMIAACARLPLALAIVVARAATQPQLSLAALANELDDRQNRLDALSTGDPDTDVRAVLSWSYHALTPDAARLLRLLGLHPGPDISVAAAASLTGLPRAQARPLIAELTQANLLVEHTAGRYTLHDLLRTYATHLAHTVDSADARRTATRRMLDHYLHTAHTADRLLAPARDTVCLTPPDPGTTPEHLTDHGQALTWFTTEHPVLLATVDHAATTGFDAHTGQLVWTLGTFIDRLGRWHDLATTGRAAIAAAERLADPAVRARAHRLLAHAYTRLGRLADAHTQLRNSLDLSTQADDPAGQAHTHYALAHLRDRQNSPAKALHHARQALDLHRAAGHRHGQASALNSVGWYYALLGDHQQALTCCQQALTLHQELGDRPGQADTWDSLGYAHHRLGHHAQAITCYEHALTLLRDLGDRYEEATTLTRLGDTHHTAGDPHTAGDAWQQALAILTDLDHPDAEHVRTRLATPRPPAPAYSACRTGGPARQRSG